MTAFVDRVDAGRQLARRLSSLRGRPVVVLGLPRGGVPVAAEVAAALQAPLDVILVRKLGLPSQPELAMGAIGEDGVRVLNESIAAHASPEQIAAVEQRERAVLEQRSATIRAVRPREALAGRTAVVVDDGIATGATARAACRIARLHGAARVVLAVPVAPYDWRHDMGDAADEYVAVATPRWFGAVGAFYDDFSATTDEEVLRLLAPPAPPP